MGEFEDWLLEKFRKGDIATKMNMVSAAACVLFSVFFAAVVPELGIPMACGMLIAFYWGFKRAWEAEKAGKTRGNKQKTKI